MVVDVAELYDELAPRLSFIVRRDVHAPPAVIEDACQFAWYRLAFSAHRIERQGALSWLATTATREAVKESRRAQRDVSLEGQLDEEGELAVAERTPGPDERAEWHERLALVRLLPLRQQRILWLKAIGYSYQEIAGREAALTERTVERQIQRGRRALKAAA